MGCRGIVMIYRGSCRQKRSIQCFFRGGCRHNFCDRGGCRHKRSLPCPVVETVWLCIRKNRGFLNLGPTSSTVLSWWDCEAHPIVHSGGAGFNREYSGAYSSAVPKG